MRKPSPCLSEAGPRCEFKHVTVMLAWINGLVAEWGEELENIHERLGTSPDFKEHSESRTGGEEMEVMNERSVECQAKPMMDP